MHFRIEELGEPNKEVLYELQIEVRDGHIQLNLTAEDMTNLRDRLDRQIAELPRTKERTEK